MNTILENRHESRRGAAVNGSHKTQGTLRKPGRQTWMVSFADLMAILLTFMVVSF